MLPIVKYEHNAEWTEMCAVVNTVNMLDIVKCLWRLRKRHWKIKRAKIENTKNKQHQQNQMKQKK